MNAFGQTLLTCLLLVSCTSPKESEDSPRDAGRRDSGLDASFDATADAFRQVPADAAVFYELRPDFTHACVRGPYTIDAEDGVRTLELVPVNEYVCALTTVRGQLVLDEHFVSLDFDETEYDSGHAPSSWELRASPGVSVTAWCASTRCFADPVREVSRSGPFAESSEPLRPFEVYGSVECLEQRAHAWEGDAITYLSEIRGNWSSENQEASIAPPVDVCADPTMGPCPLTEVLLRGCVPGAISVRTHSFVARGRSRLAARYVGPLGRGNADESGEFVSDADGVVVLASVDDALCTLTGVTGPFRDLDDAILLKPMINRRMEVHWVLLASSTFSDGPSARVRCYLFDPH